MSSGAAAGLVTGAGATFATDAVTAGGTTGFAGAPADFTVGGVVATATVVGAGEVVDLVSTVLSATGVVVVVGSGFAIAAETAGAGDTTSGAAALGSLTATGAFGGTAHAVINSAKNAINRGDADIFNFFVQDISSPFNVNKVKQPLSTETCAREFEKLI